MSADRWAAVGVAAAGILVAGSIAIYVNGPRRRRIVDEITIMKAVDDPRTRTALKKVVERAAAQYAERRLRPSRIRRFAAAAAVVVSVAAGVAVPLVGAAEALSVAAVSGSAGLVAVLNGVSQILEDTNKTLVQALQALLVTLLQDLRTVGAVLRHPWRSKPLDASGRTTTNGDGVATLRDDEA